MKNDIIRVFDNEHKLVGIKFDNKEYRIASGESLNAFFERVVKDSPNFWNVYDNYEKDENGVAQIPFELEPKSRKVTSITNRSGETKFSKTKAIIAGTALAVALSTGAYAATHDGGLINQKVDAAGATDTTSYTQQAETEFTDEEIASMNYDTLVRHLNKGVQTDAVESLNSFQSNFNNIAAPSIATEQEKQEGRQLYFNANEANALYCYINAGRLTEDDFINIYGTSGLLNADTIKDNQMQGLQIMHKFYARATQPSGLAMLAESEADSNLITEFENYVCAYNSASTTQEKTEARADLKAFMDKLYNDRFNIDSLADSASEGALSYVLEASAVYGASNQMFENEDEYTRYWEYAKTVSCDDVLNMKISKAADQASKVGLVNMVVNSQTGEASYEDKTTNDKLMARVPGALDEKNISSSISSREIEIAYNRVEKTNYTTSTVSSATNASTTISTPAPAQTPSAPAQVVREEVSREEAVKEVGETQVEIKEAQVDNAINEENQKEEARAAGFQAVRDTAYEIAWWEAFQGYSEKTLDSQALISGYTGSQLESYKLGIQQGIEAGTTAGRADGLAAKAEAEAQIAQLEAQNTVTYESSDEEVATYEAEDDTADIDADVIDYEMETSGVSR